MKLTKTIVDTKGRLIGFWLEGKESEFGGFTQNIIERPVKTEELFKTNFANNQVSTRTGKLVEQKDFKINTLPMTVYTDSGEFAETSNEVKLLSRIIQAGKLAGFRVEIGGRQERYKYDDVIRLSGWFKPGNFIVRLINNKMYIAGKPGVLQLEKLPEEVLGDNLVKSKKKRIGTGGQLAETIKSKEITNDKDIWTLYKLVREDNGVVIKLASEAYKAVAKKESQVSSEFRSLGIGEIGSPYIEFGESKLNVNTTFKKVGSVMVPVPGALPFPVYTYTFSTKSIFVNGKNHMNKFGIAVSPEGAERIKQEFEGTMVITPITDKEITGPISQLTGKSGLVFFEVEASKLAIIPPEKAEQCILKNKEIKEIVNQMMHAKTYNKFCNGFLKEISVMAQNANISVWDKKPFGLYAGLAPQYLEAIHNAGIDIFTGAFIKTEEVAKKEDDQEGIRESSNIIEIEYSIKGTDLGKLTYKVLSDAEARSNITHPMLDSGLEKFITAAQGIKDLKEAYKSVQSYKESMEKVINECRRKLWLHKIAMHQIGKGTIHTHDKQLWIENTKSRAKAAQYECVEPGCEGLFISVEGTTL